MKTNIIFGITCALIFGSGFAEDIQIGIRKMNPSSLEITCFGYAQTVAMVKIFRGQISFTSVIKIIIYNGKCDVLIVTSDLEIQCICMSEQSVVCNVSGSSFNSEDKWKCAAINYQDSNPKYSRIISMSSLNGNNTDGQVSTMLSFLTKLQKSTISTDAKLVFNTTYAHDETGTFVTAGLLPNTFSEPFIILLATCGCLITLLVAGLICSLLKRIRNIGPDLPPSIENNYLTPFGENPRTSQYVFGREASDQHDNVALRQIDNIDSRVQGVIPARIVLVDKESRNEDEIDSANNYDSISDTTPEPEMPYAEIPTQGGPPLPPVIENNYLIPLGENPRTSQYVLGREASDQRDNVALRQIDNIAFSLHRVIPARIVLVDKESRTENEIDGANNYDSISDTTPEPEMPYAEIPTQGDGEEEIEYQGEMQTHYESLPRSSSDAFAQGRTWP
ncbi:uncharacterized protein LOC127869104 isoform X2 [Dreissena polymorpha]|uniref:uncharacterized protein LOC127869104 isoform X2 n=1 Tax=Dreissena polymorpha TaxID=45954 RepID=UPI002264F156|nr:uncharacterized protein LOC127869104 isoform X2 [Dreissena polymorpha]